jgi:hypothetical protein
MCIFRTIIETLQSGQTSHYNAANMTSFKLAPQQIEGRYATSKSWDAQAETRNTAKRDRDGNLASPFP